MNYIKDKKLYLCYDGDYVDSSIRLKLTRVDLARLKKRYPEMNIHKLFISYDRVNNVTDYFFDYNEYKDLIWLDSKDGKTIKDGDLANEIVDKFLKKITR